MRNADLTTITACLAAALFAGAAHAQAPAAPAAQPAAAASGAPAAPAVRPASMGSSVTTVGSLVMLENAVAMKAAQKARVDAGLAAPEQPSSAGKAGPAPVQSINAEVLAVFGPADNPRAHISVDGQTFDNVTPGANVRGCVVERITPRCVVFRGAAAPVGTAKGASAAPSGPVCPQACWTGVPRPPVLAGGPGQPPLPPGIAGMPLPAPMPQAMPQGMGIAPAAAASMGNATPPAMTAGVPGSPAPQR